MFKNIRVSIVISTSFFLFLFICIPDISYSFSDKILFKSYAEQFKYCDSAYTINHTEKDSLIVINGTNDFQKWASDKGDIKLAFVARLSRDTYLTLLNKNKSGEKDLLSVVKECEDNNFHYLLAEALQLLADYYWRHKRYSESFEYSIKAYNLYSKYTPEEFPSKTNFLYLYGSKYYYFSDYNLAKEYFLEGWNGIPAKLKVSQYSRENSLALTYLYSDKLDSAEFYFNDAYKNAVEMKNDIWPQIIKSNLAYIYFTNKKYDEAIPLLEADVKRSIKDDPIDAANSMTLLTDIYLKKNEPEKAKEYMLQAYEIIKKDEKWNEYKTKNRFFPGLARVYAATGDLKQAYAFFDSAFAAKDSVTKRTNMMILAGVQHKIEATKHIDEMRQYEQDKKKQKWITYAVILGFIMFLIIAIMFIRSQRLKYIHSKKQLETEKKYTESELSNATSQLADFTRSISEKNDLIEKFSAEMHRLRAHSKIENVHDDEALLELQQSTILSDNQWISFQAMFEKVHVGFLDRMNKKVPGLSPIETKFMLLSKLRISKKEMASVLGVSIDAVRLNKERLRTKLNLPDRDFSLEDFADHI